MTGTPCVVFSSHGVWHSAFVKVVPSQTLPWTVWADLVGQFRGQACLESFTTMALLSRGRQRLAQLTCAQACRHGSRSLQLSQRSFSAEPAPSESDDSITVTVNPFKGHRLDPPSRDVQTNKKELLDMFEACTALSCADHASHAHLFGAGH